MANIEYNDFVEVMRKFSSLLAGYGYRLSFNGALYPVVFTITPDMEAQGQGSMFDDTDEEERRDVRLRLIFRDSGVVVETASRLTVTEEFLNKVKSLAKKAHYLFLQAYFRAQMAGELMPTDAGEITGGAFEDAE